MQTVQTFGFPVVGPKGGKARASLAMVNGAAALLIGKTAARDAATLARAIPDRGQRRQVRRAAFSLSRGLARSLSCR